MYDSWFEEDEKGNKSFHLVERSTDEEQIELILEEANAYGLRQEVKEWAEKELKEASFKGVWLSKLDAYVTAYHEWIK